MNDSGIAILPLVLALLLIPLALAMFVFWIRRLIHAAQNKGLGDGEKVAWVLIIVFVRFLGALIYFFAGRPKANLPLSPPATPDHGLSHA